MMFGNDVVILPDNVPKLVTARPDADVAKDLKAELEAKLVELCGLLDKATQAGFEPIFGTGKRWDGKWVISQLLLAKHF